jgi:hypothetical protein
MLRGGYQILEHIEKKLGIKAGQTTPDGAFTLVEEECLAACADAPMMICGDDYFLNLTPAKVDTALDDLRRRWQDRAKDPKETSQTGVTNKTLFGIGPGGVKS